MLRWTLGGTTRVAATITLYCRPGTLSDLPLSRSCRAMRTTASASSHSRAGMPLVSISARLWNSVRVKPGASAMTATPRSAYCRCSDSLKLVTHALDAL